MLSRARLTNNADDLQPRTKLPKGLKGVTVEKMTESRNKFHRGSKLRASFTGKRVTESKEASQKGQECCVPRSNGLAMLERGEGSKRGEETAELTEHGCRFTLGPLKGSHSSAFMEGQRDEMELYPFHDDQRLAKQGDLEESRYPWQDFF